MSAVGYRNIPDTRKDQVKDYVQKFQDVSCITYNSLKPSTRTVKGQEGGYRLPFITLPSGNSAIAPNSSDNSFRQSNPSESFSMWVGLAYMFRAIQAQGMLMNDADSKESMISMAQLVQLHLQDFWKHQNYYSIGDGSGALGYVTSFAAGVLTCQTAAQTTPGHTKGCHRFRKSNTYDIIDETTGLVVGTVTPTQEGTNQAAITATSTGLPNNANALVVEQGHYNKVPVGLTGLISDDPTRTLQGFDVADHVEFINSSIDLNGSALDDATLGTLFTRIEIRTPDEDSGMGVIGHTTPGQYHTLAIQGYQARQYQAAGGQANTSFGEPLKYDYRNIAWKIDPDFDEDMLVLRRPGDFFRFEAREFGPVNEDGLDWRQNPGANDVGAWEYYKEFGIAYNFGFDGDASGGNDASAYIYRAEITDSQVSAV